MINEAKIEVIHSGRNGEVNVYINPSHRHIKELLKMTTYGVLRGATATDQQSEFSLFVWDASLSSHRNAADGLNPYLTTQGNGDWLFDSGFMIGKSPKELIAECDWGGDVTNFMYQSNDIWLIIHKVDYDDVMANPHFVRAFPNLHKTSIEMLAEALRIL